MRSRTVLGAGIVVLVIGTLAAPAHGGVRDIQAACPPGWAVSFSDVPATNVHAAAVECVAAWSIARGTSPGIYSPDQTVTRAQMATFITRTIVSSGGYLDADAPDAFDDDDGSAHEMAINALADVGIVSGVRAGSYAPADAVTRAQMATFLVRAFEYRATVLPAGPDAFDDDDGNLHEPAINQVAEAGFAAGTTATTYRPTGLVRRDAMASFVARLLDKLVADGYATAPPTGEPTSPGGDPGAPPPPESTSSATSSGESSPAWASATALSWGSYGAFACEGLSTPTAYPPSVGGSGYVAWIPQYIWVLADGSQADEWGQWLWSYRGSQWQHFSSDAFYAPPAYTGTLYVRNWVYDYDTGEWWNTWSTTTPNILGHGGGQYYCYFNAWGLPGAGV